MQPLAATSSLGTAYTASQVFSFICNPARETWTFDLLSEDLRYKLDLTPYVRRDPAPKISHDATSGAVMRTIDFSTRLVPGLNAFQDLVRPRYRLNTPDGGYVEWVEGTFLLSLPRKQVTEAETVFQWSGADLGDLLNKDAFLTAYSLQANTQYGSNVRNVASTVTSTPIASNFPDPARTLPASLVWDAGKPKLAIVGDLFDKVAYRLPWFDEWGQLRSMQIPDYNVEPAVWFWDTTSGLSPITSDVITDEGDETAAWNIVNVIGQDPRTPTVKIQASYENKIDSPIGSSNTRKRVKTIQDSTIADYSSAYARARAEAQASTRAALGKVTFNTLTWPVAQHYDVFHMVHSSADEGVQSWRYLHLGWVINCGEGLPMTHVAQRIINTSSGRG